MIGEEYEAKLQSALKSENVYKNKLLLLEERINSTETQFEKTEHKLKECMSDLNNMDQVSFVNVTDQLNPLYALMKKEKVLYTSSIYMIYLFIDNRKIDYREGQRKRDSEERD